MDLIESNRIQLRREDLYEQVWSEPMRTLARKYGISDVGLAKICRKIDIPVPPVGYWQRKSYGYNVPRPPLPPLDKEASNIVSIKLRQKRERPPEVEARVTAEKDEKNRIRVPDRLSSPHSLVRRTAQTLRQARSDEWGALIRSRREPCLDIRVSKRGLSRALRIMDALVKAVEARGFRAKISEGDNPYTYVEVLGEKLQFKLEERFKRIDHVLTKEERERQEKYGWSSAPRWEFAPAGILQLRIDEYTGGRERKTWSDGKERHLEDMLNDAIAGMTVVAEAKRAERLERERQHREWLEAERRRVELQRQREEEEKRRRELEQEAEYWAKSRIVREYVAGVEQVAAAQGMSVAPGSELHSWLEWARKHADRLDPLADRLEATGRRLEEVPRKVG